MDPATILGRLLFRLGTFLLLMAWLAGSGWLLFVFGQQIYARWGSWQTYPVPDKRAMKHVVALLTVLGVWALFLWVALIWFTV